MEKMDFINDDDNGSDIYRVLDSLDIDYRVKNNIEVYLNYIGLNRSGK
jgi:hypothetical protein